MLVNCRALCENNYIKKGYIYRTGLLEGDNETDFIKLQEYQCRYFIDFRSKKEIAKSAKFVEFLKISKITWINLEIDNLKDLHIIEKPTNYNYGLYYMKILERGEDSIYKFIKFLEEMERIEPIIYGCSLGKDRTGVVSYVLLNILNAKKKDIYTDYSMSKKYLTSNLNVREFFRGRQFGHNYVQRCNSNNLILKNFEDMFIEKYKSFSNYLLQTGITAEMCANIRKKWGYNNE